MRGAPRPVERGRRREWRRGREGTVRGYVESSSVGRAVDGEGVERTGGETFDGGVEFRAAGASTSAGDKVRLESVVTMSVDGADVLVQTREVSVAGKQS